MAPPPLDASTDTFPEALLEQLAELARASSGEEARTRALEALGSARPSAPLHALLDALVARAEEHAELRQLAATDPLTGVANRRAFDDALAREVARAARTTGWVSVVMLDLDGLKRLNDAHGHEAGDAAIRALATVCLASVRRSDLVARLGGDELAVILPESTRVHARRVAARIQARVADAIVAGEPLGVSVGIAAERAAATSPESLMRLADAALYEDKRRRREADQAGRGSATTYAFQQSSFSTASRSVNSPLPSPSSSLPSQ